MDKEYLLRDARTVEAMQKGYMGLEGKFSFIANNLGDATYRQGSPLFNQTFLEDYFEEEEEGIKTFSEEEDSYQIGYYFDGLSSGINMSILILYETREITCRYNGRAVYKEIAGELERYAPEKEWEDKIMELHALAVKTERKKRPRKREELIEAANKERKRRLEELSDKWGFS